MRILGVGNATVDIVNLVAHYPREDEELRAESQWVSRGGNVTNTLVVLSQLEHSCSWAGTLADHPNSSVIRDDLSRHGVDCGKAVVCRGVTPVSYVTLNRESGSRTIVHHRELREFGLGDFQAIDLQMFDWVHFEGRNIAVLEKMLCCARRSRRCSLEIEKPHKGIEGLLPLADVLMFSRAYANSRGFQAAGTFLQAMREEIGGVQVMTCTWGEQGAWALGEAGMLYHSEAYAPPRVVDTLGAGDVFNAAIIDGLGRGGSLGDTLVDACRLAGAQCGRQGLSIATGRG